MRAPSCSPMWRRPSTGWLHGSSATPRATGPWSRSAIARGGHRPRRRHRVVRRPAVLRHGQPVGCRPRGPSRGRRDRGVVTLGAAHEGAPGRAHGGIVAGLFDDVFGFVLGVIQQPAFTGELKVRYERPTPLHRALLCRGRLASRQGRKLMHRGRVARPQRRRRGGGGARLRPCSSPSIRRCSPRRWSSRRPPRADRTACQPRRRSMTVPPLTRTRSSGLMAKTSVHVPAAAHTTS